MFKTLAISTLVSSAAGAVAAVGGVVTAVQVVRGQQPVTAAQVTLGATAAAVVATGVSMFAGRRVVKAAFAEMNREAAAEAEAEAAQQ